MITNFVKTNRIEWLEYATADLSCQSRGKSVNASQALRKNKCLSQKIPLDTLRQTVDGHFAEIEIDGAEFNEQDIDCLLIPDDNACYLLPWLTSPTALLICDIHHVDNTPALQSPRALLRHVLKWYQDKNWQAVVAPELEFFLFKPPKENDRALKPMHSDDTAPNNRQPYSTERLDDLAGFFDTLKKYIAMQGIVISSLVQEVGNGQFEINLTHGDALQKADEVFLLRRTVRECAKRYGMRASFMAKPVAGEVGSAMHIHQSVVDLKDKKNLFSTDKGENTALFDCHIGGLQKYLPEAMALFFPFVNSYRRLARYLAAPLNVEWAFDNRTVGLRVPIEADKRSVFDGNRRVENRLAGADVNPYLAIATTLALGYQGMVEKTKVKPAYQKSAYEENGELPQNLDNALTALDKSQMLRSLFGDLFIDSYVAVKQKELSDFNQMLTPWEVHQLSQFI